MSSALELDRISRLLDLNLFQTMEVSVPARGPLTGDFNTEEKCWLYAEIVPQFRQQRRMVISVGDIPQGMVVLGNRAMVDDHDDSCGCDEDY